ncbi:unnamed protein product [Moneuplotes crassus]|uniref:Uncharacterized protein n=1 Tax=Euplotes crassus TaxID=5936 RepID=A0AAD1UE25_EUPCR|nr:unnamed protein product [Moneuplotes crassus]
MNHQHQLLHSLLSSTTDSFLSTLLTSLHPSLTHPDSSLPQALSKFLSEKYLIYLTLLQKFQIPLTKTGKILRIQAETHSKSLKILQKSHKNYQILWNFTLNFIKISSFDYSEISTKEFRSLKKEIEKLKYRVLAAVETGFWDKAEEEVEGLVGIYSQWESDFGKSESEQTASVMVQTEDIGDFSGRMEVGKCQGKILRESKQDYGELIRTVRKKRANKSYVSEISLECIEHMSAGIYEANGEFSSSALFDKHKDKRFSQENQVVKKIKKQRMSTLQRTSSVHCAIEPLSKTSETEVSLELSTVSNSKERKINKRKRKSIRKKCGSNSFLGSVTRQKARMTIKKNSPDKNEIDSSELESALSRVVEENKSACRCSSKKSHRSFEKCPLNKPSFQREDDSNSKFNHQSNPKGLNPNVCYRDQNGKDKILVPNTPTKIGFKRLKISEEFEF